MFRTTATTPELTPANVTVRHAGMADERALAELAELDSSARLRGPALVAEADSRVLAALPLGSGRPIADPFEPTADAGCATRASARAAAAHGTTPGARAGAHPPLDPDTGTGAHLGPLAAPATRGPRSLACGAWPMSWASRRATCTSRTAACARCVAWTSTPRRAPCSACSARTAPARPRQCGSSPRCCAPTGAAPGCRARRGARGLRAPAAASDSPASTRPWTRT